MFAIAKINKNADKKETEINRIKIKKIIILVVKNLVKNVNDFKKETEIAIEKIAIIITEIETTIIIRIINFLYQKYTKIADIVIKTQYTIITINLIINNNTAHTFTVEKIDKIKTLLQLFY